MIGDWFREYILPEINFLGMIKEQVHLLFILNDMEDKMREDELENSFAFCCPKCSGLMRIDRKEPWYSYCKYCNSDFIDLFYGAQKIFKVDDGCVAWWVVATDEKEAVQEVIEYERAAGCDLIKEEYWKEEDLDNYVCIISPDEAKNTIYYDEVRRKDSAYSNMWEEFCVDSSTRVVACSEW